MRVVIKNIGFDNLTMDEAENKAFALIEKGGYIVTPNPEIVWMARKNSHLKNALNNADAVVADGIGIVYAAKILKTPLKARVAGIELVTSVLKKLAQENGRVYLLGAKPSVAETAAKNIEAQFPGIVICGTHDGYFDNDNIVLENVRAAEPQLLFVCLGAPRQELWMNKYRGKLPGCLMMGLGGALDVFAGTVKRAPESWRKRNLEWLYRLICQPSRLWRMLRLPVFLLSVVFERLSDK